MFLFFTLICFSLEKNYAIFSNFKRLLMTTDKMALSIIITKIVVTLGDITFKVAVSKKIAWILLLFISFNLVFFSWQTITSKKDLFHQTSRSSIPFYFIAMGQMLLLLSPLIVGAYLLFPKMVMLGVTYLIDILFNSNPTFKFPYSIKECLAWGIALLLWTAYAVTLFIGHFSFKSLLNVELFLKHWRVVFELIAQIITSFIVLLAIFTVIGYCCWEMDPIYFCFFGLLIYFISTIGSSSRWIFMAFFLIVLAGGAGLYTLFGYAFFKAYMVAYVQYSLIYFSFFFITSAFFSALAYTFASTAFVFQFNQTPATDVKEQSPEKLRRIDDLYTSYLKEHKNDVQDNFFHHMEE